MITLSDVDCNFEIFFSPRDAWLTSLLKTVPNENPYDHLTRSMELTRYFKIRKILFLTFKFFLDTNFLIKNSSTFGSKHALKTEMYWSDVRTLLMFYTQKYAASYSTAYNKTVFFSIRCFQSSFV